VFGQPLACWGGRGVFWLAAATLGNKDNAGGGATRPSVGKAVLVSQGAARLGWARRSRSGLVGSVLVRRSW
jgi:serine acetyltransferase